MKKIIILLIFLTPFSLLGQESEWTNKVQGSFIGPIIEVGMVGNDLGFASGFGGGIYIDYWLIGAYRIDQFRFYKKSELKGEARGRLNYQGLWLGYSMPVEPNLNLYGGAKLAWGKAIYDDQDRIYPGWPNYDEIFVWTPEVGTELTFSRHFRMAYSFGYRGVNGIKSLEGWSNKDFSSWISTLSFKVMFR